MVGNPETAKLAVKFIQPILDRQSDCGFHR
jgi:hypothetical protein